MGTITKAADAPYKCARRQVTRALLGMLIVVAAPGSMEAQATGDHEQVRAAALDYIEGFYEGDTIKFMRSVAPSVYKYGYSRSRSGAYTGMQMPFEDFMASARGIHAEGERVPPGAPKEIVVFDVQAQTASVKIRALWGTDYLLLAKINGRWMIKQVLWESAPPTS